MKHIYMFKIYIYTTSSYTFFLENTWFFFNKVLTYLVSLQKIIQLIQLKVLFCTIQKFTWFNADFFSTDEKSSLYVHNNENSLNKFLFFTLFPSYTKKMKQNFICLKLYFNCLHTYSKTLV